jgi:ribonuclease HI
MLFPFIASTIECEATALQHALLIAVSCGFERVKFESDCQMTVNAVNNGYIYLNELESLLSTCMSLISSNASYKLTT